VQILHIEALGRYGCSNCNPKCDDNQWNCISICRVDKFISSRGRALLALVPCMAFFSITMNRNEKGATRQE